MKNKQALRAVFVAACNWQRSLELMARQVKEDSDRKRIQNEIKELQDAVDNIARRL